MLVLLDYWYVHACMQIPNGLGVMFAVAQLVLYAVYYKSTQRQIADRKRKVAETGMTEVVVVVNAEGNNKVDRKHQP